MCFHIHPDHREPKTADSDIPCFKMLVPNPYYGNENTLVSPYKREPYIPGSPEVKCANIGTPYRVVEPVLAYTGDFIDEGLHSFSTDMVPIDSKYLIPPGMRLYNAVIPNGSTYYHNPKLKEYVSNRLVVKESYKSHNPE